MEEDLLKLEDEFARAVARNDADALDGLLADDWIIVDPPTEALSIRRGFWASSDRGRCPTNRWRTQI